MTIPALGRNACRATDTIPSHGAGRTKNADTLPIPTETLRTCRDEEKKGGRNAGASKSPREVYGIEALRSGRRDRSNHHEDHDAPEMLSRSIVRLPINNTAVMHWHTYKRVLWQKRWTALMIKVWSPVWWEEYVLEA